MGHATAESRPTPLPYPGEVAVSFHPPPSAGEHAQFLSGFYWIDLLRLRENCCSILGAQSLCVSDRVRRRCGS